MEIVQSVGITGQKIRKKTVKVVFRSKGFKGLSPRITYPDTKKVFKL